MNPRLTLATAVRVLRQVRADHRTLALLLVVPCALIGLLAWVLEGSPLFDRIGASLLGVFPFVVMFVVTSVATLRERTSGTMERLLSTPLGKGDFLVGYAVAFGGLAVVQALVATAFARFQAVQFMPAFVLPQFLLCGLIVPREQMPQVLEHAAALLPLTYAVEAMTEVTRHEAFTGALRTDLVALIAFAAGALVLGALTLRRRTP